MEFHGHEEDSKESLEKARQEVSEEGCPKKRQEIGKEASEESVKANSLEESGRHRNWPRAMSATGESAAPLASKRRYEQSVDGIRELEASYSYWTSKITDVSFQCCIALIAANWALHATGGALIKNVSAVVSVFLALAAVLASLVGALWIGERTRSEFYVAVSDRAAWEARWEAAERIESEWPYTPQLTMLGRVFTWLKVAFPVLSGVFFVYGAIP